MCIVYGPIFLHSYVTPGEEYEEKQRLEEQLRAAMDKYKYKRRQIRELQEDLQTMSNTMLNLTRDEEAYQEMIEEKEVSNHVWCDQAK